MYGYEGMRFLLPSKQMIGEIYTERAFASEDKVPDCVPLHSLRIHCNSNGPA
jgi:hypothetical protein